MMIQTYLSRTGKTQTELAEKANISKQLLNWHLKNPGQPWRKTNAENLVKAMYGEIITEKVVKLVLGED